MVKTVKFSYDSHWGDGRYLKLHAHTYFNYGYWYVGGPLLGFPVLNLWVTNSVDEHI